MERGKLIALLRGNDIPIDSWGTGIAKTVDHLLKEINAGESELLKKDGALLRAAVGSTIRVYYRNEAVLFHLKEEKQVFKNGRVKKRELAGDMSIGEKLKPGEIPAVGAWRALAEELGITEKLPLIPLPDIIKCPVKSVSFPGLLSLYTIHAFEVFLPEKWYRPEGYVEKQSDKTSYFVWMKFSEK